MAHTADFTITQGTDPNSFVITDTSTDPDPNLTGRRIYLNKADGTTLVPEGTSTEYIDWPLSDGATKTLTDILDRDYSLNVVVEWDSSSPEPGGSYVKAILQTFTAIVELFLYSLTQMQAVNPNRVQDNGYLFNKTQVRLWVDDANNATSYNDQYLAQLCLDRAWDYQQNTNIYF